MGCYSLLQGIFPTQGLNPGLLHCTQELSQWAHPLCRMLVFLLSTLQQGSPSPGSVPRVLVRNWVAPQRVKSRCVSEASSVFTAVPLHSLHHLSSTSFQISSIIRLSQEHRAWGLGKGTLARVGPSPPLLQVPPCCHCQVLRGLAPRLHQRL